MNKRESSSNKQNHLQVEKDISELFPLAGNGLRLLSVLTPKGNLPNGFSAASIFPNKPFGINKGKSRTQTYKDSLTNLNSFTKPSQQTEIGLMKSKSPAHVGHFFRGETLRQPSVLSKTSKKHLDSKHLKSSLSLLGLTGKLTEDSTAALFSSTGGAKVKTLHANTSGLGNSLYTLLTTPTMTTNMKKEFIPDQYEHRHQNMSIRDHGTTDNKRLDYLLENPEDDFHFQTQKHPGKHPRGQTSYASGKDLSARVHKKQSVHSIDPQQLTTVPGHPQHTADSKRSRIIKGTCMQPKYAPVLEKTDKKSPTGKQGSLSKKHPFAKKLQVAHSRTETILNHRESLLEKSHKPNRKLARQLSIENVGSVCGSSVGKNSKRSFDTRNGLAIHVNHYSSAVQHTKAKKAKLATVGSNRILVEHNYMSKLEGEMPLDLLGNTRKKKAAVNRIKSGSGDLSKFNTLPSAHIPVAVGSLHKKENSASSLIRRCASQRTFEEVKPSARRTAHKRVDSKKNLRTSRSALSKSSVHHLQSVLQENQPGRSDSLLEPVIPARTQKMGLHYRTGSLLKEENKRQVFTKSTQNSSTKVLKSRIKHKKSKTIRSPPKHNQKPSLNIGNSKFALDVGRNGTQYKHTSEYEIAKSRTDRDRTDPSQTTGRYRDVREHTDEDGFVVFRTEWADNPHNIERLESNSSDQDSEVILEEDVLDVEELPSCHKIKILPSQILSRNVSNNKDPVLKGEEKEPTTKERKAHNEPTNTADEKWPIRGQYRRKTLMGDEILENLTIIKSNQKTHIGKSSSENGGDPYNPPATQNSDDSMRFGRRKLIFAESQQVQSGKKSVIKSTGDDLAQFLEELKAHQQKMNHEFVEWVDPPNEDKKSISRRPHEINSDLSSLGELELVEQPRTPVNANSSWIELMQKSERHTRGLLLYTLSEQAQINYLPNRLYIIDMISRICAERNCSRWVFFNTINMLDIFVSRTALKLDAGFRTYAEVCIFISQKLQQQACLDYRKLPGSTNCGYLMDSKIHTSTALEAMILQTVKGLTPEHNLSSWVSVLADCWDDFATTHKQIKNDVDRHKILFTRRGYSTRLLQCLNQVAVFLIMKFETRNYQESLLVAANIYLLVALVLKLYTQKEIAEYFPEKSGYLFNDSLFFNQVFKEFLEKNLGVSLSELLPYIQHSARFYCFIEKVVLQSGGLELADSSQDQTVSKLLFPSSTKGNRPKSSSTSKPVANKNNRAVGDHTGPGNHQKDSHGAGVGKRPKSNQKQQVVDLVDKSSTKLSEVATPQRKRRSGKSKGSHPRTGSDKHCHDAQLLRTMLEHPEKSSMTKLG